MYEKLKRYWLPWTSPTPVDKLLIQKHPIRILYTIPNFISAGSGRVLANIAERLDRSKFHPTVCVARKGGNIESELDSLGIRVIELPFTVEAKPYMGLHQRARRAAGSFKPYQFDLWHSFHYGDDYTEPIIARLAGAKAWVYTKKNMMWGGRAWIVRSILASRIIADNHDMPGMFFSRFGLHNKVRVIPHSVDIEHFKPIEVNKKKFHQDHNLPGGAVLVGLAAHLLPIKGHDLLVDAAAQIPDLHLFFAGRADDERYKAELDDQIDKLGLQDRVHFIGFVSDMPEFLAHMDVIALPTRKRGEGCPVALLEAMACGKACIATDVPGSRDLIEDGVSGVLVSAEDSSALVSAIQYLRDHHDLRSKMGRNARLRIEEAYTIDREVSAHERLYSSLLGAEYSQR